MSQISSNSIAVYSEIAIFYRHIILTIAPGKRAVVQKLDSDEIYLFHFGGLPAQYTNIWNLLNIEALLLDNACRNRFLQFISSNLINLLLSWS